VPGLPIRGATRSGGQETAVPAGHGRTAARQGTSKEERRMSSLVVDTNMSALQALNDLNATDSNMSTAINRLSSGLQIQNAATGPAQYVISQALESQSNGYTTAISNAQDGVSLIQTASGALSQISSILQTMDQLALTSSNGATQTATSLAANQAEFADLQSSITEIAKTTTFGTKNLLVGKVTTTAPAGTPTTAFTGTLQVGAFDLGNQQITLSISAVTAKSLKLTSSNVSIGTATKAAAAVSSVQTALATVDAVASTVGATQNELQAIVSNLTIGQQNLQAASSQLVDVNMAQEMTTFSTDQILMQSGVAMLAQAQQAPSLVLKLV
jgi:flagellin